MYNVLPPSSPEEPFDHHGRFHFLVHGFAIGVAVSAAVPGLPQWLTSVLGAQVIGWSALGLGVSLVVLKLVFGGSWKTAASLLFILTGGLYLGSIVQKSALHGAGSNVLIAAALVLAGLCVIYQESRRLSQGAGRSGERTGIRLSTRKAPLAS